MNCSPLKIAAIACLAVVFLAPQAIAQVPSGRVNYLLSDNAPPGVLGGARLARWGAVAGYYQPVRILGPEGVRFALATSGGFEEPEDGPLQAGLLVGAAYRLRVTDIPYRPGEELFPTIEVIDRLYPPPGEAHQFPIPIVLTEEDLEAAANGQMVTRVIYLEDPQTALPVADRPNTQRHFDVRPEQNALQTADQLGRPVAILRIGSRILPTNPFQVLSFVYGGPPWVPTVFAQPESAPEQSAIIRTPHIARVPSAGATTTSR